jgi:aspartokinase-like uncharacterized kinase
MSTAWRRGTFRTASGDTAPLVVKLGGSLLVRDGWAHDVAELFASLSGPLVIVVGGGPLVEALRAIDRAEPAPTDLTHRLAIECMGHTARLVAAALGMPLVAECDAVNRAPVVLDAPAWLGGAGRLPALPVGWHVTSDSIAASVAAEHGLPLLLVKSVPPPHDELDRIAAAGWVDEWFPTAARPLVNISWAAPR